MEIKSITAMQNNLVRNKKQEEDSTMPRTQSVKGTKKLVLALAGLAVLSTAGMGLCKDSNINQTNKTGTKLLKKDLKMKKDNLKVDFITPKGTSIDTSTMQKEFDVALNKLLEQKKTDKNLSWVDLPEKLIQDKYVDTVYKTVTEFKAPFANSNPKLIFIALGNPANADEIAKSMGLGHNLTYACDITPAQMKDSIKNAGGDLGNIQVIISSKSGSTFESNQTYNLLNSEFVNYYKNKGIKKEDIQQEVAKHFLMLTDKNPEKSTLKKKAGELGIKTIDCVDNLHSAFGDLAYSMPVLAYSGLSQLDAQKMLEAADNTSKRLSSKDFKNNTAAQIAAFDKLAKDKGATKEQFIFHDAHFSNFSATIEQIYKESLREMDFTTSVYPRSAHSGLECDISKKLSNQPTSIITNVDVVSAQKQPPIEEKYLKQEANLRKAHELNAQNEGHFQKNITLRLDNEGVSPQAIGEFLTLKSFVAFFKNEFEHNGEMKLYNQSYVNAYKDIRKDLEKSN